MASAMAVKDLSKEETEPRSRYLSLLDVRTRELSTSISHDNLLSNLRLLIFVVMSGLGIGFIYTESVSAGAFSLSVIAFLSVVVVHNQVVRKRRLLESSTEYFKRALKRMDGEWMGQGDGGEDFAQADHLYAADLDICGKGSAFELISQAQTGIGRATIADWLLNPGSLAKARMRQERVRELVPKVELRESLVVSSGDKREKIQPGMLTQWVQQPEALSIGRDSLVFTSLFVLAVAGIALWALFDWGALVFLLVVLSQGLVRFVYKKSIVQILSTVSGAHVELEQMARILTLWEKAEFENQGAMGSWRESLKIEGYSISSRISQLGKLVHRADAMKNQLFMLVGFYFGWDHLAAVRIEAWRVQQRTQLPLWLDTLGEFEALISLSCYAFEHPENVYPEFVESPGVLQIKNMCHPLLDRHVAVGNNIELGPEMPLLLISGSNMSGKSTLLRGVGLNVVLAMCGVPVCAESARLSAFKVGATLSIHDSLMSGQSRFYAEISRIQGLVNVSRSDETLLFLIDEILHGTNSFDRRKGARAILESILNDGSVGFVTTHDLALAQMADDWPDRATNMHLSDRLDGQALVFDYRLKPGIVQQSNAIELMRSVGLPV